MRATAQDRDASALMGIDVNRAISIAFIVGGLLAGAAGFIALYYNNSARPGMGFRYGLFAFTAAVVGGVGNLGGAVLGGFIIGIFLVAERRFCQGICPLVGRSMDAIAHFWSAGRDDGFPAERICLANTRRRRSDMAATTPSVPSPVKNRINPPTFLERNRENLLLAGAVLVFAAYPLVDERLGWGRLGSWGSILIYVILAMGLNIVVGYAGLLDLGYAAFFAIGAYTMGFLTSPGSYFIQQGYVPSVLQNFWAALAVSWGVAALFGILLGAPTLRLRGDYLAIVTLGFGEIVPNFFLNAEHYTNGTAGVNPVAMPFGQDGIDILGRTITFKPTDQANWYWLILTIAVISLLMIRRLTIRALAEPGPLSVRTRSLLRVWVSIWFAPNSGRLRSEPPSPDLPDRSLRPIFSMFIQATSNSSSLSRSWRWSWSEDSGISMAGSGRVADRLFRSDHGGRVDRAAEPGGRVARDRFPGSPQSLPGQVPDLRTCAGADDAVAT